MKSTARHPVSTRDGRASLASPSSCVPRTNGNVRVTNQHKIIYPQGNGSRISMGESSLLNPSWNVNTDETGERLHWNFESQPPEHIGSCRLDRNHLILEMFYIVGKVPPKTDPRSSSFRKLPGDGP